MITHLSQGDEVFLLYPLSGVEDLVSQSRSLLGVLGARTDDAGDGRALPGADDEPLSRRCAGTAAAPAGGAEPAGNGGC